MDNKLCELCKYWYNGKCLNPIDGNITFPHKCVTFREQPIKVGSNHRAVIDRVSPVLVGKYDSQKYNARLTETDILLRSANKSRQSDKVLFKQTFEELLQLVDSDFDKYISQFAVGCVLSVIKTLYKVSCNPTLLQLRKDVMQASRYYNLNGNDYSDLQVANDNAQYFERIPYVKYVTKRVYSKKTKSYSDRLYKRTGYEWKPVDFETYNRLDDRDRKKLDSHVRFGDIATGGQELIQVAVLATMDERARIGYTGMTDVYTKKVIGRKVYISDRNIEYKDIETTPVQEVYKAVRRYIANERSISNDRRCKYVYIGELVNCDGSSDYVYYRLLKQYAQYTDGTGSVQTLEEYDRYLSLIESLNLSKSQLAILRYKEQGYSNDRIANELHLSKSTIKTHVKRTAEKAMKTIVPTMDKTVNVSHDGSFKIYDNIEHKRTAPTFKQDIIKAKRYDDDDTMHNIVPVAPMVKPSVFVVNYHPNMPYKYNLTELHSVERNEHDRNKCLVVYDISKPTRDTYANCSNRDVYTLYSGCIVKELCDSIKQGTRVNVSVLDIMHKYELTVAQVSKILTRALAQTTYTMVG